MHLPKNCGVFCRMIKIEHSIFALPFAYAGAFLAAGGWPGIGPIIWLTIAMVGIRSFAMGLSRVADLPYDRKNPRAAQWPLATGEITPWQTWQFCGVMATVFVVACAAMNSVCLALSPVALVLAVFYSYIKRITWLCHFVLGAMLAFAPLGGWLCVTPSFSLPMLLLALAVLFWVAGFDSLYSCQDALFDSESGQQSLSVRFGLQGALIVSAYSHIMATLFLLLTGMALNLSFGWYFCLAVTAGILWWQHRLVGPDKLQNIRFAFALNGPVSILLLIGAFIGS